MYNELIHGAYLCSPDLLTAVFCEKLATLSQSAFKYFIRTATKTNFTCLNEHIAGGGAIEMELSRYLRDCSRTIAGKEQLLMGAMAKAFEVIPRQLCENAGFDATNILNKLRQSHAQGMHWYMVLKAYHDLLFADFIAITGSYSQGIQGFKKKTYIYDC